MSHRNIPNATYRNDLRGDPLRQREAALVHISDSDIEPGVPNGGIVNRGASLEVTRLYATSWVVCIGRKELKRENIGRMVFLAEVQG